MKKNGWSGAPAVNTANPSDLLRPRDGLISACCAVAAFGLAHEVTLCAPLIAVFFVGLFRLARQASARVAVYFGLAVGLCSYGPQLTFFWPIFHQAAIVLWLVLGSWLVLFLLLQQFVWRRMGPVWGTLCAPPLWTGLEYFRSELYSLRFSWLNAGYLLPTLGRWTGMYGVGFTLMLCAALVSLAWTRRAWRLPALAVITATVCLGLITTGQGITSRLAVAGVQLEEASDPAILHALDQLYTQCPDTSLFVLSEYSFQSPVPPEIKAWCAAHKRWLVAGGKQFVDAKHVAYRNTAFVIGPDGNEVFEQGKSRPIQFFDDGVPADQQAVWDSPWGKVGLCICYDLSYTRVTDGLIRRGAQIIIVPTMDVTEWGAREHALHARVAPARAAEYGVPIFRLCSSGISQAVQRDGRVIASAPFPGQGDALAATLSLPPGGGRLPIDRFLVWPSVIVVALAFGASIFVAAYKLVGQVGLKPRIHQVDAHQPH